MGPIAEGIVIGIGGTAGAAALGMLATTMRRLWKTPKRLERIERLIPPIARALLVMLRVHMGEEVNGDVKAILKELDEVLTDGAVSQKEKK
jgi:hypothetical protein